MRTLVKVLLLLIASSVEVLYTFTLFIYVLFFLKIIISESESDLVCGIFWVIENVSLSTNISINNFINSIRKHIVTANGLKELKFFCTAETESLSRVATEQLNQLGFTFAFVNKYKNAAKEELKKSMTRFVENRSDKPVIILISGDAHFVEDIKYYKNNHYASIYLIFFKLSASKALADYADRIFCVNELREDVVSNDNHQQRNKNKLSRNNNPMRYLMIRNLPFHKDKKSIQVSRMVKLVNLEEKQFLLIKELLALNLPLLMKRKRVLRFKKISRLITIHFKLTFLRNYIHAFTDQTQVSFLSK